MSVFRSPLVVSSLALLAALSLFPGKGMARERRPPGQGTAAEVAPMQDEAPEDIIFVMPPLKPVKGALASKKGKRSTPPV
ncbi:MAG: hypothetical protein ACR652_20240 [Methylocystis sp.]|uniref:hypothetical protein n=1 Tax=Methylocystis sp. TaxID=1911079 RepID=UPI003DA4D0FC